MRAESKCCGAKRASHRALVAFLVLPFSVVSARCATNSATAKKCGADMNRPPLGVLADSEGSGRWQTYQKPEDIPDLNGGGGGPGGVAALIWRGSEGKILILLEAASEDWDTYTEYCFDANGQLSLARYELRTAWRWGFREEGSMLKGVLRVETSAFFDTRNDHAIPKPEDAGALTEALKPTLYLVKSQLPFYSLLAKIPALGAETSKGKTHTSWSS